MSKITLIFIISLPEIPTKLPTKFIDSLATRICADVGIDPKSKLFWFLF